VNVDLHIAGGRSCEGHPFELAIEHGRIVDVGAVLSMSASRRIDVQGAILLPGMVDAHVHFNEPGHEDWEGIATGSRACAAGGVTTFVDMPLNSIPCTVDGASFDAKRARAEASSLVDFALWGGIVPGALPEIAALAQRGVAGFKAFLCDSGLPEFSMTDADTLREAMRRIADTGLILALHAEWPASLSTPLDTSAEAFLASRPVKAEVDAVCMAAALAGETGCRLHIVHISHPDVLAAVLDARARGVDITCETCPHYLLLDQTTVHTRGALAKCAPPLRNASAVDGLWQGLQRGQIDTIGSDHSPSPPSMKEGSFGSAWGGIAGVQYSLSLLASSRPSRLPELVQAMSFRPAERLGFSKKGRLEPGYDADFVVYDPSDSWTVSPAECFHRHPVSVYDGLHVRGRVKATYVRGQIVFEKGQPVAGVRGRLITPENL